MGEFRISHNNNKKPKIEEQPSSENYRAFVGPKEKYDVIGSLQFSLLTFLGLREHHYLLDIGCGSLRGGKLFIPYLLPERYFGIEPEQRLIEEVIKKELGEDCIKIKKPVFNNDSNFTLSIFNQKFDFLLAQSIFTHTSQAQIKRCLSEAKKVMKINSIFAATFFIGNSNYEGDEWVYPGAVKYTTDFITDLIKEYGMESQLVNWPHPSGQKWVIIFNPKNKEKLPEINNISRLYSLNYQLKSYRNIISGLKKPFNSKIVLKILSYLFYKRTSQEGK